MKLDAYINKTSNLYAQNRLLKFVVVCIGIAVLLNGFFTYEALHYQRVVILPPVVDRRVEITSNQVDDNYVRLFTRYAMTLLNNYTAATVDAQFDEFLKLVTPSAYPQLQKTLSDMADSIKQLNMSSVFYPQTIKIDDKLHTIEVIGHEQKTAGDTIVEKGRKKYTLKYKIINARFYIDGIAEEKVKTK